MQRAALVIRTYGNQELAKSMAASIESSEMKKLRAELNQVRTQLGVMQYGDHDYYQRLTREARKKYRVKPMSPFKQRVLQTVGLIMVLIGAA